MRYLPACSPDAGRADRQCGGLVGSPRTGAPDAPFVPCDDFITTDGTCLWGCRRAAECCDPAPGVECERCGAPLFPNDDAAPWGYWCRAGQHYADGVVVKGGGR